MVPQALPVDVTPNLRVLGFTFGVSVLCAIVFGTVPALRASRIEPNNSLKGGKTGAVSALRNPLGKAFVVDKLRFHCCCSLRPDCLSAH
jgi:hypothetical protein